MQATLSGESIQAIDPARRRWWVLDGIDDDEEEEDKGSASSTSPPSSTASLAIWGGSSPSQSRVLPNSRVLWTEPGASMAVDMLIKDAEDYNSKSRLLAEIYRCNVAPFLQFHGPQPSQLYACGGRDEYQEPLATVEMFDTWWGRWVEAPNMLSRRAGCSAAVLPTGELMVIGGYDERGIVEGLLASGEIFCPREAATASLKRARWGQGCAVLQGRIYVVGGCSLREGAPADEDFMETLRTCEVYDPDEDRWSPCTSVNTPRAGGRLVALGGTKLVIVGGCDDVFGRSEVLSSVEIFDLETEHWTVLQRDLSAPRTTAAVAALNDHEILVFGGTPGNLESMWNESSCEVYEVSEISSQTANSNGEEEAANAAPAPAS
eukprot:CAMPEP_0206587728 /NCGR_PEP_ID=MMETSP0325_2-20121206/37834_1 /ASSEMBLY_ACC=CAM_ASM_000347 /TAXON_ID=2866 /ORGANISM="Crypthecodinium cohnii, Strain Seligo" /LENGTH=376 /DNA_ID=CAMNT_0054095819 /DNA_START=130 /DNA_END=1258 /DNA_ORIENTATION=+